MNMRTLPFSWPRAAPSYDGFGACKLNIWATNRTHWLAKAPTTLLKAWRLRE